MACCLALGLIFAAAAALSETRLIERALGGDRAAGLRLMERLIPVIRARCMTYLHQRVAGLVGGADADDLAQEIWLTLFKDDGRILRAYDPRRGSSIEGYVGLVARREIWRLKRAAERVRRGGDQRTLPIDDARDASTGVDPEQHLSSREVMAGLEAHLVETLPPRGQVIMRALYTDGLDVGVVASMLGVSRQVVYNWQHRIKLTATAFLSEAGVLG
ncbi:MAG: sigma-70 family RNA polymerase sigma factor [Myxococcales bacterium]|nr:sigma-70 family RNA polymerase sigma factor [Myxococcales bacterium]